MEDGRRGILDCPDDAVLCAIGTDPRCGSWIGISNGCLAGWSRAQFAGLQRERLKFAVDAAVVDGSVEVSSHSEFAGQHVGNLLIDIIGRGVKLAHLIAVNNVNIAVLPSADCEMPGDTGDISYVGQQQNTAGSQIEIAGGLTDRVVGVEVIGDSQFV